MVTVQELPYQFSPASNNDSIEVQPLSRKRSSPDLCEDNSTCFFCSNLLKKWGTRITILAVLIFSFAFNGPRWFELVLVRHEVPIPVSMSEDVKHIKNVNSTNGISEITNLDINYDIPDDEDIDTGMGTSLRITSSQVSSPTQSILVAEKSSLMKEKFYVLYYHLLGSCIVMILVPAAILMKTYFCFRKAPSQQNKTHRIMLVIITMFIICHCPKVRQLKTVYFIICNSYIGSMLTQ